MFILTILELKKISSCELFVNQSGHEFTTEGVGPNILEQHTEGPVDAEGARSTS